MDVIVIGGGAIGLSIAEALDRRGAGVTVLEAGECGRQASAGNAGWVTPALSHPVPAPGMMAQAFRWMFNPASPLLVRPSVKPDFLRWSRDFALNCNPGRYGAGMAALVALNRITLDSFDGLVEAGVEFEMHSDGLLFVAATESELGHEEQLLRRQLALGYPGELTTFSATEVREFEPAVGPAVIGGIYASAERHVRPEQLTAGLRTHLLGRGVKIREHTQVRQLRRNGSGWTAELAEDGQSLDADRLVVATGVDAATLLTPFGIHLPLIGAKGYSVTEQRPAIKPQRPVYLIEKKVGVSPFGGGVRLAGTLELGSDDLNLRQRRVEALDHAAHHYLNGWKASTDRVSWAGFRPLLPDGLPAIGPVPGADGLFVATGHSMLGITLAPATGSLLAPLVADGLGAEQLAPFSLARFGNLGEGAAVAA